MASGQAWLVTPTSVLMSPPPPPPPLSEPRQPASAPAVTSSAAAAAPSRLVCFMRYFLLRVGALLVGEWPGLPVVADAQPDPEQSTWLEDQERDDEGTVEHRLQLEDVGCVLVRAADEGHVLRQSA